MSAPEQFTELPPPPNGAGSIEQQLRELQSWAHMYHQRVTQLLKDHMQRLENIAVLTTPATADQIVEAAQSTLEE